MANKIKVWCDIGVLTCKNVGIKFTDYGMMLETDDEEVFIPFGSLRLVRCKKRKGRSHNIKLKEYGEQDCI